MVTKVQVDPTLQVGLTTIESAPNLFGAHKKALEALEANKEHCKVCKNGEVRAITSWWIQLATHLKNVSQNGNLLQVKVNIKNI